MIEKEINFSHYDMCQKRNPTNILHNYSSNVCDVKCDAFQLSTNTDCRVAIMLGFQLLQTQLKNLLWLFDLFHRNKMAQTVPMDLLCFQSNVHYLCVHMS